MRNLKNLKTEISSKVNMIGADLRARDCRSSLQPGKMYTLSDLDDLYSNAKQNMRAYQQNQSRQVIDYINESLRNAKK